jgi:hypothetical protein
LSLTNALLHIIMGFATYLFFMSNGPVCGKPCTQPSHINCLMSRCEPHLPAGLFAPD